MVPLLLPKLTIVLRGAGPLSLGRKQSSIELVYLCITIQHFFLTSTTHDRPYLLILFEQIKPIASIHSIAYRSSLLLTKFTELAA